MTRSNAKYELLSHGLAQYRGEMLRVAGPYAGGAIEAEDIVQMAAMIAWRRIATLRDGASVGGWLVRITGNVGRNVAEKRARRKQLRADHFGPRPESPDPFTRGFDDDPRRNQVLTAAGSLPPAQREEPFAACSRACPTKRRRRDCTRLSRPSMLSAIERCEV